MVDDEQERSYELQPTAVTSREALPVAGTSRGMGNSGKEARATQGERWRRRDKRNLILGPAFSLNGSAISAAKDEEEGKNGMPLSVGVALSLSRFQGGLPRTLVAVNQSDSIPLLGARLYSVRNVAILRLRPWISDFGASVASLSHGIILRGLDKQPARTKDER